MAVKKIKEENENKAADSVEKAEPVKAIDAAIEEALSPLRAQIADLETRLRSRGLL